MTDPLRDLLIRLADQSGPAPQDPTLWHRARRSGRRKGWLAVSGAVLAVCAVSFVVGTLDLAPTQPSSTPSGPADSSPTPSEVPRPMDPTRSSSAPNTPLLPGRYVVPIPERRAPPLPLPTVDLPAGFWFDRGFGAFETIGSSPTNHRRVVAFWNGEALRVAPDFCVPDSPRDFKHPGQSVADLAQLLAHQRGLRATDPVPISVGGYHGLYLEMARPVGRSRCDVGVLWVTDKEGPYNDYLSPGGLDRLWILDVEGERIVITASTSRAATKAQRAELTDIVTSTTFTDPEG